MANIQNVKLGNDIPNKLMSNDISDPGTEGKKLWSWYKYANDAGGYFVQGLWFCPRVASSNYRWPWELGIAGGALKDVNNGARYWGYVQDGFNKNITSGMTKNFSPVSLGNSGWGVGVSFFAESLPLDFSEHPIVMTFKDGRFDNYNWTEVSVDGKPCATVSEDKRTITVYGTSAYGTAIHGYAANAEDQSIDAVREIMENVIVDISGLDYYREVREGQTDLSSVELWDAYIGDNQVWHKDKTMENCWLQYGYATSKETDRTVYKVANEQDSTLRLHLPEITDLDDVIYKLNDSQLICNTTWNIQIANIEYWETIRDWYATHDIVPQVIASDYIYQSQIGLFEDSNFGGHLTLNINSKTPEVKLDDFLRNSQVTKVTLNIKNQSGFLSSLHNMFRGAKYLEEIIVTGNDAEAAARDLCGAFELCNNLHNLPANFINYGRNRLVKGGEDDPDWDTYYSTDLRYTFEVCGLYEIPQYGDDRFADDNTLIPNMINQAFNGAGVLTTIYPVLDLRYVRPHDTNRCQQGAYMAFVGNTRLTDIRIKNLNHGNWRFDGSTDDGVYIGNLANINDESIAYLVDNLYDLTTHDPNSRDFANPDNSSAGLWCPSAWQGKITSEQIQNAKNKGWTIYINNIEQ